MLVEKITIPEGSSPVWRFEIELPCPYREGKTMSCGPFTAEVHNKDLRNACFKYTDSLFHFPEPNSHLIKLLTGGWLTGIYNNKDLRLWMPSKRALKELYEAGFRLRLYGVKDKHIVKDKTQCGFKPGESMMVKEYTLEEAYTEIYRYRDDICLGTEDLMSKESDHEQFLRTGW